MKKNNLWILLLIIILIFVFLGSFDFFNFNTSYRSGFYGLNLALGIIAIISAIWVIYDVLVNNKGLSSGMKMLWIICALFFSIITAVIYYFVGRNLKNDLFKN